MKFGLTKLSTAIVLGSLAMGANAKLTFENDEQLNLQQDIHFMGKDNTMKRGKRCAMHEVSDKRKAAIEAKLAQHRKATGFSAVLSNLATVATNDITVQFHVIYKEKRGVQTGNIPDSMIFDQMDVLNNSFAGTGFTFTLGGISRTKNNRWYTGCYSSGTESKMKSALAVDPATNMNVYTCSPSGGILGYARFPDSYAESSHMHGVVSVG